MGARGGNSGYLCVDMNFNLLSTSINKEDEGGGSIGYSRGRIEARNLYNNNRGGSTFTRAHFVKIVKAVLLGTRCRFAEQY